MPIQMLSGAGIHNIFLWLAVGTTIALEVAVGQDEGNNEETATTVNPTLNPLVMFVLPIGGSAIIFFCCCMNRIKKKKKEEQLINKAPSKSGVPVVTDKDVSSADGGVVITVETAPPVGEESIAEKIPPASGGHTGAVIPEHDWFTNVEKSKTALNCAMEAEDLDKLDKAIFHAKKVGVTKYLQPELNQAYRRRAVLLRLKKNTADVVAITRDMLLEVRDYRKPPRVVHDVIIAALLVTGDHEDNTQDWSNCQILCNTLYTPEYRGFYFRLSEFKLKNLHPEIAARGLQILCQYNIQDVTYVSRGASMLYSWARLICEESLAGAVDTVPAVGLRQAELLAAMKAMEAEEKSSQL